VFPREAAAVGLKAIEQGVAGIKLTEQELLEAAFSRIKRAREETRMLMQEGFIKMPEG
jgi:malate dehydrogenase (oxaloacetate-decarboxylating)